MTNASDHAPPERGDIIIARHGRPALDRTLGPRLDWRSYVDWWARYEAGDLAEGQHAPEKLKAAVANATTMLTSERLRAQTTMKGARPDSVAEALALFNEAPLPPPRLPMVRFLPKTWNVLARTVWYWGHKLDGESHAEARQRARLAAALLHEKSETGDVFLAAHGWFNRMMRPELKRLGWRCIEDGGDRYWGFRRYRYKPR